MITYVTDTAPMCLYEQLIYNSNAYDDGPPQHACILCTLEFWAGRKIVCGLSVRSCFASKHLALGMKSMWWTTTSCAEIVTDGMPGAESIRGRGGVRVRDRPHAAWPLRMEGKQCNIASLDKDKTWSQRSMPCCCCPALCVVNQRLYVVKGAN